jgi:hypothetical protein
MPDVERGGDDLRLATYRTTQPQTTPQYLFDLFKVCFQVKSDINANIIQPQRGTKGRGALIETLLCGSLRTSAPSALLFTYEFNAEGAEVRRERREEKDSNAFVLFVLLCGLDSPWLPW